MLTSTPDSPKPGSNSAACRRVPTAKPRASPPPATSPCEACRVRFLPREKLTEEWDLTTDSRRTDWEIVQRLIRTLGTEGETGAARLLARIGERGEGARNLAYRLYGICDRKGWASEALAYNSLVTSWPEISRLAAENPSGAEAQTKTDV
jgi:putative DNA methylase